MPSCTYSDPQRAGTGRYVGVTTVRTSGRGARRSHRVTSAPTGRSLARCRACTVGQHCGADVTIVISVIGGHLLADCSRLVIRSTAIATAQATGSFRLSAPIRTPRGSENFPFSPSPIHPFGPASARPATVAIVSRRAPSRVAAVSLHSRAKLLNPGALAWTAHRHVPDHPSVPHQLPHRTPKRVAGRWHGAVVLTTVPSVRDSLVPQRLWAWPADASIRSGAERSKSVIRHHPSHSTGLARLLGWPSIDIRGTFR